MPFYPDDAPVPTELRTEEFLLRPLRATDVDLDYEAVMATQEALRRGSGGRGRAPTSRSRRTSPTCKATRRTSMRAAASPTP